MRVLAGAFNAIDVSCRILPTLQWGTVSRVISLMRLCQTTVLDELPSLHHYHRGSLLILISPPLHQTLKITSLRPLCFSSGHRDWSQTRWWHTQADFEGGVAALASIRKTAISHSADASGRPVICSAPPIADQTQQTQQALQNKQLSIFPSGSQLQWKWPWHSVGVWRRTFNMNYTRAGGPNEAFIWCLSKVMKRACRGPVRYDWINSIFQRMVWYMFPHQQGSFGRSNRPHDCVFIMYAFVNSLHAVLS